MNFISLCYHYIKPNKNDLFPRILGSSQKTFQEHLSMLINNYESTSLQSIEKQYYSANNYREQKTKFFLTFDDGLSDHFWVAKILAKKNIKAGFSIPTCILKDKLPANPQIIHYCIAHYGIKKFLDKYRNSLENNHIDIKSNDIVYSQKDNPWEIISQIKSKFKYQFTNKISRKLLIDIYQNSLLKDFPEILNLIHLSEKQIYEILDMGHSIMSHTYVHISVAASKLSPKEFRQEIIEPQKYLEKYFNTKITTLSYPFGTKKDYLSAETLIKKTKSYKLAFTIEKNVNTPSTNPLELGRYMPNAYEDTYELEKNIIKMIKNKSKS